MTFLEAFDWPGNIRQLENTCRYLTVMSASSIISMDDLPQDIFNDKGLDENQKSFSVAFFLYDPKKTMEDSEIDHLMQKLILNLEKNLNAIIRK